MLTDEYLYRSPATMSPLRLVTLYPYLSVSLPSDFTILSGVNEVNAYGMNGRIVRMSGKTDENENNC